MLLNATSIAPFRASPEMLLQAIAQDSVLRNRSGPIDQDDEVELRQILFTTKYFAREAFQPVTGERVFDDATRDRQAQTSVLSIIRARQHGEIAIGRARSLSKYAAEFRGCRQALEATESRRPLERDANCARGR